MSSLEGDMLVTTSRAENPAMPFTPGPEERATSFDDMKFKRPESIMGAFSRLGWTGPMPVQGLSVNHVLEGRHVIGLAKAGTGKTAAFSFPMLDIIDSEENSFQALVVVPTKDLADMHYQTIRSYAQAMQLISPEGDYEQVRIRVLRGVDDPQNFQPGQRTKDPLLEEFSNNKPHVVVATMGKLLNFLTHKSAKLNLNKLKFLVIDEVDTMLANRGFAKEMDNLVAELEKSEKSRTTQVVFWSATFSNETQMKCKEVWRKADASRPCILIRAPDTPKTVSEYYVVVCEGLAKIEENFQKYQAMIKLLDQFVEARRIVFFNSKALLLQVYQYIKDSRKISSQQVLFEFTIDKKVFMENRPPYKILLATDSMGRGIDLPDITFVLNFDSTDFNTYKQRCGRTGRASNMGVAVTLVSQEETTVGESSIRRLREKDDNILPLPDNRQDLIGWKQGPRPPVDPVVKAKVLQDQVDSSDKKDVFGDDDEQVQKDEKFRGDIKDSQQFPTLGGPLGGEENGEEASTTGEVAVVAKSTGGMKEVLWNPDEVVNGKEEDLHDVLNEEVRRNRESLAKVQKAVEDVQKLLATPMAVDENRKKSILKEKEDLPKSLASANATKQDNEDELIAKCLTQIEELKKLYSKETDDVLEQQKEGAPIKRMAPPQGGVREKTPYQPATNVAPVWAIKNTIMRTFGRGTIPVSDLRGGMQFDGVVVEISKVGTWVRFGERMGSCREDGLIRGKYHYQEAQVLRVQLTPESPFFEGGKDRIELVDIDDY